MKNITVPVDDDTYQLARIRATELGTSVSALVRNFLKRLAGKAVDAVGQETVAERRRRLLAEIVAEMNQGGRA